MVARSTKIMMMKSEWFAHDAPAPEEFVYVSSKIYAWVPAALFTDKARPVPLPRINLPVLFLL